ETQGNIAFWNAVAWIYQHTRGGGTGLPKEAMLPNPSPALRDCLTSPRPEATIRAQASEAGGERIPSTPTPRVLDRTTGKSLTLQGLVEGDAILSAFDLLASSANEATPSASDR